MTLRNRIGKLERVVTPESLHWPLTVLLVEAAAGQAAGRNERTNSAGLPILEIVYNPAIGPGPLPSTPHKLINGIDPVDLV